VPRLFHECAFIRVRYSINAFYGWQLGVHHFRGIPIPINSTLVLFNRLIFWSAQRMQMFTRHVSVKI